MNERILELAKQAGLIQYTTDSKLVEVEKFAELIVRKCAKVAFNDWCEGDNEASSQMAILKHFGVEE